MLVQAESEIRLPIHIMCISLGTVRVVAASRSPACDGTCFADSAMKAFRAPRWLPGGHAQTIWPVFFSRRFDGAKPVFRRERWPTPDGDFIDVDWQGPAAAQPLLVLFHGLEGSSSSHYAQAFAAEAKARGARLISPEQPRKCGTAKRQPRRFASAANARA